MRYEVKHDPTEENVTRLIEAAAVVEPEFVTIVRCAYLGGIKAGTARHLGPLDLHGDEIELRHPFGKGISRRELQGDLLVYLTGLTDVQTHYCPRLHQMTTMQFYNCWKKVCAEAGFTIQMLVLNWPYRDAHKAQLKWERTRRYLDHLASNSLSVEEVDALKIKSNKWKLMGSKAGNKKRLLTRAQFLAPLKLTGTTKTSKTNGAATQ